MSETLRLIAKAVKPIRDRVMLMVARGVVRAVSDAGGLQLLQLDLLADELRDGVERIQNYGLTSHPHPGAVAAVVFVGGSRDHGLAIAVDDRRYRLVGLAPGEVALYDDLDQVVHLKRSGISVETPLNVHINAGQVLRLEGDGVEIHGRTYVQTDVHGKGIRETWAGGTTWNTDAYTAGAAGASTEHGIQSPCIPSDHPEAG